MVWSPYLQGGPFLSASMVRSFICELPSGAVRELDGVEFAVTDFNCELDILGSSPDVSPRGRQGRPRAAAGVIVDRRRGATMSCFGLRRLGRILKFATPGNIFRTSKKNNFEP
jgi:hypothetical protein